MYNWSCVVVHDLDVIVHHIWLVVSGVPGPCWWSQLWFWCGLPPWPPTEPVLLLVDDFDIVPIQLMLISPGMFLYGWCIFGNPLVFSYPNTKRTLRFAHIPGLAVLAWDLIYKNSILVFGGLIDVIKFLDILIVLKKLNANKPTWMPIAMGIPTVIKESEC